MLPNDPLRRILFVDLSQRSFRVEERPELFEETLGGAGTAIRLLEELCPPGADPLGPDNPIILAVGPLVGLFPLGSKTVAMFKSPHTGNLGESHAGGRSAVAIRMAGSSTIVIQGQPDAGLPGRGRQDGHFRDAAALGTAGPSTPAR
jgi:aldehyde:ferredoxin oxidoreductase